MDRELAATLAPDHAGDVHRSVIWVTCFFVALVVNPNFGCGSGGSGEQSDYTYGESEMEAAVVGTYAGTVNVDGATEAVTLTIARSVTPGGVAAAALHPLCGSRTFFVRPAGACIASSAMALTATLTSSGAIVKSGDLTGEFRAYLTLDGQLDLSSGPTRLYATYQNGRFSEWMYSPADGSSIGLDLRRE